jgi:DMSO/TMAO reductase YedYZ molybdopterin-dependent catalytic subunit
VKLFGSRQPEEVAKRVPPGNRQVKGWPVLHYGPIPRFDPGTWDLRLSGLVGNEVSLSYDELKSMQDVDVTADMHCVTGWTTLDNVWTGVSFRKLVELCRPAAEAAWVISRADHGYTANLSLQAMLDDDVLVAWAHKGEDLTPEHGYPLRLVVPKRYAWKSTKWLRELRFTDRNRRGFWEVRGYHNHADPWPEERYSYQETPEDETRP